MKTPRVQDFDPTAKIPQLGSPMENMPIIQKPKETQRIPEDTVIKPESMQTGLHANLQTSKDASMQARKPANLQAGKHVSLQTGTQVMIEKYSSYLPHEYKRELKRIAFETDREVFYVVIAAAENYSLSQHAALSMLGPVRSGSAA